MKMSNAWWAYGSEFQIATTAVAEIIDINGPNMSRDAIDVTWNDGSDGYREFLPGWRDGGEVSISANWLPGVATHDDSTGLLKVFEGDSLQAFKIVTADDGDGTGATIEISFNGIVTSFNTSLPLTEQGKLDCTIKISGEVTFDGT
jgi:predicted secreted protein